MKTRWTVFGVAALLLVGTQLRADDTKKEVMKFKIVSLKVDGKDIPKKDFKDMVLTVTGNKGVLTKAGKVISEATSKMDQSKDPWTIDITITKGENKGKTLKGIMKEKNGKMTVCWGPPDGDRPKDFSCKKGSKRVLEVYEMIKE
jgi:uncharacterized protein (TIGR03067 family)